MTALTESLQQPLVRQLGWTLVHFLWQGLFIALVLAGVLRLLRQRSANLRYLTGCGALFLMLAAPLLTFTLLARAGASSPAAEGRETDGKRPFVDASDLPSPQGNRGPQPATPEAEDTQPGLANLAEPADSAMTSVVDNPGPGPVFPGAHLVAALDGIAPWAVMIWLTGVLVLGTRLLGGWVQVQRIKRTAIQPVSPLWEQKLAELGQRLGVSRPVRLLQSALADVPAVVGWLRPVILLPASALAGLTPAQLETVLAHELAHVRRHDYLINLLQSVVETLLFYHPAMWWLSRQVRQERENCCDDLAVAVCGSPLVYARALTNLEELRRAEFPQPLSRLTLAASGGVLLPRIRRLLGLPQIPRDRSARWLAGALVIVMVAAFGISLRMASPTSQAGEVPPTLTVPDPDPEVLPRTNRAADEPAKPNAPEPKDEGPLKLEIALQKAEYAVGDAIPLTVTYTNTSKETLTLFATGLAPGEGFDGETFEVTRGRTKTAYTFFGIDPAVAEIKIDPGKSWKRTIKDLAKELAEPSLAVNGKILSGLVERPKAFDQPGEYEVRLRYDSTLKNAKKPIFSGSVQSNTAKLTLKPQPKERNKQVISRDEAIAIAAKNADGRPNSATYYAEAKVTVFVYDGEPSKLTTGKREKRVYRNVWLVSWPAPKGAQSPADRHALIDAQTGKAITDFAWVVSVEPPDPPFSDKTKKIVESLKADLDWFSLHVSYHNPKDKLLPNGPYYSIGIFGPEIVFKPSSWGTDRLAKDKLVKIIDYLAADGFFDRAQDVTEKGTSLEGPCYSLIISNRKTGEHQENLGWDLKMLGKLDALRKVLDGDAATSMDKLLKQLDPWRKEWTEQQVLFQRQGFAVQHPNPALIEAAMVRNANRRVMPGMHSSDLIAPPHTTGNHDRLLLFAAAAAARPPITETRFPTTRPSTAAGLLRGR